MDGGVIYTEKNTFRVGRISLYKRAYNLVRERNWNIQHTTILWFVKCMIKAKLKNILILLSSKIYAFTHTYTFAQTHNTYICFCIYKEKMLEGKKKKYACEVRTVIWMGNETEERVRRLSLFTLYMFYNKQLLLTSKKKENIFFPRGKKLHLTED